MARVFFFIVLALVSSSCGDSQQEYQNSRLKSLVNDIGVQMGSLGFPVNTDEISVQVISPEAMTAWFNTISDESRQENKNYVAYGPAKNKDSGNSRLAFYDPNSKTLVVRSGIFDELSNGYLAHELAHVYQDQKWGLKNIWSAYQDNPSRELFNITQYMIEGHAELARQAYEQKYTTNPVIISDLSVDLGKVFKSECVVCKGQSSGDLPYTFGLRFLLHQYRKGGWDLAEDFLNTLPLSSEQILHPSKLQLDNPKALELPKWDDKDMPAQLILDGPMGEASLLSKLMSLGIPNFDAFRAASGWDGDRAQIYLTQKGEKALLWRVVFDRDIDAKQLEKALKSEKHSGYITRKGRLVDWIMSESPSMTSKLKEFLKLHPQKLEKNASDEYSTELVELKAEGEAMYFGPSKRMRIVIGPKND